MQIIGVILIVVGLIWLGGCGASSDSSNPPRNGTPAVSPQETATLERAGVERVDASGAYSFGITLADQRDGAVSEYRQPPRWFVEALCATADAVVANETSRPMSAWSRSTQADDYVAVTCRAAATPLEKQWVNEAARHAADVRALLD